MHRQKRSHSRSVHNAPAVPNPTGFQSTRLGPHSHSRTYSTRSGSFPQGGAPSAAMAELYTTAGPSGSQRSASREKRSHFASRPSGYEPGSYGFTDASRSSSSPESRIPREFGDGSLFPSSACRSLSSNGGPLVDSRRDFKHPHGESPSSNRDQPRLDRQTDTSPENHGIFEPIDYIRAWQETLQPANWSNVSSTKGVVPSGEPALATGLPKTFATSNRGSAPAPKASNSVAKSQDRPTSRRAVQLDNHFTSDPAPPSRNSSWLSWFGFGKKPTPEPALRGRTLVHRRNRRKVPTGPYPPPFAVRPPMLVPPAGTVPASASAPNVPAGPPQPPQPPQPQHVPAATQLSVLRPKTTVDVAVQTIDHSDPDSQSLDPPSPVPSLSWLYEDDADNEGCPPEDRVTSVVPESNAVEQHVLERPPSPSTNLHSLFPPLPPHIPPPETQIDAVLAVVKSVYAAHPEVNSTGITLLVPPVFRLSCPEFYLLDGLQHFDDSYMRLMTGFWKLNVFYEEINRKPENTNPSPEFFPIPPVQIPQASCSHRFTLGVMLSKMIKFKWILHSLYGTTVGMTGFLRANDTRPIGPEESQSYVKMRDDIRRFTDRARGSYIPPDGVCPQDTLDLDEVRKLVEMLILAGGKMFTKEMGEPIVTPPTLPLAGPFLVTDLRTPVAAPISAPTPVHEATTRLWAEGLPEETSSNSAPHILPPSLRSLQMPPPAYKTSPDGKLGSYLPNTTEPSVTLSLPRGVVPTSDPEGGIRWSDSQKPEGVFWGTGSTIAKEMRSQFVERTASEHPILSDLLPLARDADTRTALAVIVQKYLGESMPKKRKDATSRDELWGLITGPEAFMGMTEVVREVAVQLSSQRDEPAGLDGYIMKRLVEALMKQREVKPDFVQAFSSLKTVIPQPSRAVPPPSTMQVNADSKGKRKWTDDDKDSGGSESPGKRRKLEEDAKKMPPPSMSILSSTRTSTSAASSESYRAGGVTISNASVTTFGEVSSSSNGSRFASPPPGAPRKAFPSFGQQFKRRLEFHGKLGHPRRFASPGVRVLPHLPLPFGHPGLATSSSQASASASTSTSDTSTPTMGADSSSSSRTTEPVWVQPVHTIKRTDMTRSSVSAFTSARSSSLVLSSSASSSAQSAWSSSSRATASSWSTSVSSPEVSGTQSTVRSTSTAPLWDGPSSSVSNSDIRFGRQSDPPVMSGRGGDMQAVSGTPSRAVSSSSASTMGYSAVMHPSEWDVEMNDDEFEEVDVFAV